MAVKPPIDLSVRWNLSVRPEGAAPLAFDGELDAVSTPVEVSSIEFIGAEYPEYQEQYVLIHFEVPKGTVWSAKPEHIQQILDIQIAQGLRARVQGQGFLGANILALEYLDPKVYPVEPVPWTPKHYYIQGREYWRR